MPRKSKTSQANQDAGQFAYEGLERVIHEKARLGILVSLAANEKGLNFNDLKVLCSLTDGNLSRHVQVLIDAKLVSSQKAAGESRTQTTYKLTASGRKRFTEYIDTLEAIVADAHLESRAKRVRKSGKLSPA